MRGVIRSATAVALAAGALWVTSAPVFADDSSNDLCRVGDQYYSSDECKVLIDDVSGSCDAADTPILNWAVSTGVPVSTVKVSLKDSAGHTATLADQPLNGSATWPDAVNAASTVVTFTTPTDPAYTASASVSTPACATAVLAADDAGALASTGAQSSQLAAIAGGLVVVGGVVYLASRRRGVTG